MLFNPSFIAVTEEKRSKLIGYARVMIPSLRFFPDGEDYKFQEDKKKVANLKSIFQKAGCDRTSTKHRIYGIINAADLDRVLDNSGLVRQDLNNENRPPLLHCPPDSYIYCPQGRSRVRALSLIRKIPDAELWWPVELYEGTFLHRTVLSKSLTVKRFIYKYTACSRRGIRERAGAI